MKYDLNTCLSEWMVMRSERSEWESEWMDISEYLLPGRGIYTALNQPRKRKLSSPRVINTTGRDALRVLASGVQGGLIPSNRPWLELKWRDKKLNEIDFFKDWIYEAQEILVTDFADTNFYPVNSSAITEVAGYGTCAVFVDSDAGEAPFQFIALTAGEYVFAMDYLGRPNKFHRMLFMSPKNLVQRFGYAKCSANVQGIVKQNQAIGEDRFITVLESIYPERFQDKPFTRTFWELGANGTSNSGMAAYLQSYGSGAQPLRVDGFHEFPVAIGRWETLGQDIYGIGPGSEALPEIKRLQEMEKAVRMAVHKDIDPPLTAPAYMRGKLKSLPGSKNYYRNPQDKVTSIYNRAFNYQGIDNTIARVEQGIKIKFFNDIFLTTSRDPNASPMKAAEVHVKEGEKLLRLGSVIERLVPEFFDPIISRCFQINLRNGRFPEIPPEYKEMMGDVSVLFTSPLAQAQKLLSARSIEQTLAFVGQAQAVAPDVMDKIDIDAAVDEFVDAHGTSKRILRSKDEVSKIREDRRQAQQQAQDEAKGMAAAELAAKTGPAAAGVAKTRAETGEIITSSLVDQQSLGGLM